MKTYTKTHSNKKAAETHLAKIKKRGGIATVKDVNGEVQIDYYFPEKKALKKKAPSKKAPLKKTAKKKRYDVISPDGFTIRMGVPPFTSIKARDDYFKMWKKRFEAQGYYSSNRGRIPLEDLEFKCEWLET